MSDKQTIDAYDANIEDYIRVTSNYSEDQKTNDFLSLVRPGGYILDLGCGPAHASAIMREHGFRVDPVDASPKMVESANNTHNIGARLAEFSDINETAKYDGVWASFSLLHASKRDFRNHLKAIHTALVDDGVFNIGMKLGTESKRDRLGRYYSYYTQQELTAALNEAGFKIVKTKLGEGVGLAGDISPWITILSQKA